MNLGRYVLLILIVFSSTVLAKDWQALYSQNSEAFWRDWEVQIARASKCAAPDIMKRYLSAAAELGGNASVTERNAEIIESLAISQSKCLLAGLELLPSKSRGRVVFLFLLHPLYHEPNEIEDPLQRLWSKGLFPASRKAFLDAQAPATLPR